MNTYNPKPIDLSDVKLSDDLNELQEAIAENAQKYKKVIQEVLSEIK